MGIWRRSLFALALLLATCGSASAQQTFSIITATGTWSLPGNWPLNNTADYVACIGSGGNGSLRDSSSIAGSGGGGGEFAEETGVVVSSAPSVTIGTAGGTTNTSFPGTSVTITANYGHSGTTTVAGAGGTGSTNSIHYNGGAGGRSGSTTAYGGGGAGGLSGAGGTSSSAVGGTADNGTVAGGSGAVGNNGAEWITAGSGSGGAGAASTGNGFAGGSYGGGGGAHGTASGGTAAAGKAGVCVVAYEPALPSIGFGSYTETISINGIVPTALSPTPTAGLYAYVTGLKCSNSGAAATTVELQNGSGGTVIWGPLTLAANTGQFISDFKTPIGGDTTLGGGMTAATPVYFQSGTATNALTCTINGYVAP